MPRERRATLGLRKGRVELAPHHPEWRRVFADERNRLSEVIGSDHYRIEHIGSTSVPGLPAKPILDIAVLITQRDLMPALEKALISKGYTNRGDKGRAGGHLFVLETSPDFRTIHLHALVDGDPQWPAYLRFRDALRADERLCNDYAKLKSYLVNTMPDDRAAYTAAKNDFIQRVLTATKK